VKGPEDHRKDKDMKILKIASAILCFAAMTTIYSSVALAQSETGDYNHKTTVTFNGPVEIPGVHLKGYSVLPAGTYVFKLVDSTVNRHIVQIFNADESKVLATILAIPNMRIQRTDKTVITFRERPNGEPPALRAWFYPDATWGEEFVYPKSKAKEIAMATNTPVLYNKNQNTATEVTTPIRKPTAPEAAQMNSAPVAAYNPAGEEEDLSVEVTAPSQPNNEVAAAAPPQTPAPTPQTSPAPAPAELPKTASPLGLIMLCGLWAVGGALGIRSIRQRC
jgi:hypothetical protein